MKLRVAKKKTFEKWKETMIRESDPLSLDTQTLSVKLSDLAVKEIDLPASSTIADAIHLLSGESISKPECIADSMDNDTSKRNRSITTPGVSYNGWVEDVLYCLSVADVKLSPEKRISDYEIQENDLLLWETENHAFGVSFFIAASRDFEDFIDKVIPIEEADTPHYPPTEIKSILLYTDEDVALAEFMRRNYGSLNKMIGDHLQIYIIEQPARLRGVLAKDFWKGHLEQSAFSLFRLMGWTRYKPYNKADAYKIADALEILPEALPCLVIFHDIESDAKTIISVSGEYKQFFRKLVSVVRRAKQSLERHKLESRNKEMEEINSEIKNKYVLFDLSPCNDISDPIERRDAEIQLSNKLRSSGCISFVQLKEIAEKVYDTKDRVSRRIVNNFEVFRREVVNEWKEFQAELASEQIQSNLQQESLTNYIFRGNTVFINRPTAPVQLKDFQKGEE